MRMKSFVIGEGKISVQPLAFESLGVRGMSTLVKTDDVTVLIDPGSALGPRFNLSPHRLEYIALAASKKNIIRAARKADVIVITHYHHDHYTPFFHEWTWLWSSPEMAEKIYSGKLILAKDISENINPAQRRRGYLLWKKISEIAEVKPADGKTFDFGSTVLKFSKPVPHGFTKNGQGNVLMLSLKSDNECALHASDVQGPIDEKVTKMVLREKPKLAIIGGPPLYLLGFKIGEKEMELAERNLRSISRKTEVVVVDHHLLRSADYAEFLNPIVMEAKRMGHRVCTASELVGLETRLLEARRRELHQSEPMHREWYKKLKEMVAWDEL
ncbi:MAG: MBL fold metallo-hydrolase [Candidatus Hadarchaeales archaeon]